MSASHRCVRVRNVGHFLWSLAGMRLRWTCRILSPTTALALDALLNLCTAARPGSRGSARGVKSPVAVPLVRLRVVGRCRVVVGCWCW